MTTGPSADAQAAALLAALDAGALDRALAIAEPLINHVETRPPLAASAEAARADALLALTERRGDDDLRFLNAALKLIDRSAAPAPTRRRAATLLEGLEARLR